MSVSAIRQSPILILDEPTTGLDEENRAVVAAALGRLAQGRTTLLITHDLALGAFADRIIFLEAGRIAESGTQDQLMRDRGRYAAIFSLQTSARSIRSPAAKADALIA